jgi:lysophospholipid acyltransferase (LPLAT)-like uncharacterized protein
VHGIEGWRKLVVWPLALLVQLWCRSLRFEISEEHTRLLRWSDQPIVYAFWHNRLFIAAEVYRRNRSRGICGLVSASRDGAWLAAFLSLLGIQAVRGSSSRLGREAAVGLAEALRAGKDVAITPDGPRGPCYNFRPGALVLAQRTGAPMILFGADYLSAWRLGSWDRFYLPKPFSTIRMRCELVSEDVLANRDGAAAAIGARLVALNPD